jgi:hypothetical protein
MIKSHKISIAKKNKDTPNFDKKLSIKKIENLEKHFRRP